MTVSRPSLGNLFQNTLTLMDGPAACPVQGITCLCDVHFQQDIVHGAADSEAFNAQKRGFVDPATARTPQLAGLPFYRGTTMRMGDVTDDSRLFFSKDEVKARWVARRGARTLRSLGEWRVAIGPRPEMTIGTPGVLELRLAKTPTPLALVEVFVNEESDAGVEGACRPAYSHKHSGNELAVSVELNTAGLAEGTHRVAINVHFADGSICYWYSQPPHTIRLVPAADGAALQPGVAPAGR